MNRIHIKGNHRKLFCTNLLSSVLCHVICGDGEYIMEMVHEDFINLDLLIKERFPLLEVPSLPSIETRHDIYKKRIYDYFAVVILFSHYPLVFWNSSNGYSCYIKMASIYPKSSNTLFF